MRWAKNAPWSPRRSPTESDRIRLLYPGVASQGRPVSREAHHHVLLTKRRLKRPQVTQQRRMNHLRVHPPNVATVHGAQHCLTPSSGSSEICRTLFPTQGDPLDDSWLGDVTRKFAGCGTSQPWPPVNKRMIGDKGNGWSWSAGWIQASACFAGDRSPVASRAEARGQR